MTDKISVKFVLEDTGNCRQIYADKNNKYYARLESGAWYTATSSYEPDTPLHASTQIEICNSKFSKVYCKLKNGAKESLFMGEFANVCVNKHAKKLKAVEHSKWRKWLAEDKEKHNYSDYTDNWVYAEVSRLDTKVLEKVNYLGVSIEIVETKCRHNICGKEWSEILAVEKANNTVVSITKYRFNK